MSDKNDDDATLVIPEQPRTEIYWGANGHLVIKQEDSFVSDFTIVLFTPGAVPELIRRLHEKLSSREGKGS